MRTRPLSPRESAKLISSKSKDVSICQKSVEETSRILFDCFKSKKYSFKIWKSHELHPSEMMKETIDWIVVLDTLNFSFWTDEDVEPWTVRYEGKDYTGYWALCASINRALKVGKYFWTVLVLCQNIASSHFSQFIALSCGSIVVCMLYLLFLYEGCYMKTLCTIKPLLHEGTSLLAFQGKYCSKLLPFSPTSLFRYSTCT